MLGLALGDALGATVEFLTPNEIRTRYGEHREIVGGGWLRLPAGQVTDDTTMAFALAQAWLEAPGVPDGQACGRAFDAWMRAKPVDIGNTVRRGIVHFRNTGAARVPASEDAGNGAAMRCLPVALAMLGADPEAVAAANAVQAHVTHNNRLSDAGCECLLAMVQEALCGASFEELMAPAKLLVETASIFDDRGRRIENPSGYIVDTMQAVLQGLLASQGGFEACLVDVVNRGGDADTTGAIAGMVAGALAGEAGLPETWLKALDPRVRVACVDYADALIARAPLWAELGAWAEA